MWWCGVVGGCDDKLKKRLGKLRSCEPVVFVRIRRFTRLRHWLCIAVVIIKTHQALCSSCAARAPPLFASRQVAYNSCHSLLAVLHRAVYLNLLYVGHVLLSSNTFKKKKKKKKKSGSVFTRVFQRAAFSPPPCSLFSVYKLPMSFLATGPAVVANAHHSGHHFAVASSAEPTHSEHQDLWWIGVSCSLLACFGTVSGIVFAVTFLVALVFVTSLSI